MKRKMNSLIFLVLAFFTLNAVQAGELKDQMEKMDEAFDAMSDIIEAEAGADALEPEVKIFLESARAAREVVPESLSSLPEAQRMEAFAKYQEQMDKLIEQAELLNEAVKASDYKQATIHLKKMKSLKKTGHDEFKKPDPLPLDA